MTRQSDLERAKALAVEAIALCEQHGLELPAAHFQHGLDSIAQSASRVAEDRAPWGIPRRPAKRDLSER